MLKILQIVIAVVLVGLFMFDTYQAYASYNLRRNFVPAVYQAAQAIQADMAKQAQAQTAK